MVEIKRIISLNLKVFKKSNFNFWKKERFIKFIIYATHRPLDDECLLSAQLLQFFCNSLMAHVSDRLISLLRCKINTV